MDVTLNGWKVPGSTTDDPNYKQLYKRFVLFKYRKYCILYI